MARVSTETAPTLAKSQLGKILLLEKQKGHGDNAVVGGLDRFLERCFSDQQPFPAPVPSYAAMTLDQRARWVAEALASLEGQSPLPEREAPVAAKERPRTVSRAGPAGDGPSLPVTAVKGVAGPVAAKLGKLGISTVRDLLYHFPRRYNDFSRFKPIRDLRPGEEVTILVQVWDIAEKRVGPRSVRVEAAVGDDSGNLRVTWFNPYVSRLLKHKSQVILSGRVSAFRGFLELQNPEYELMDKAEELIHTGRIVPVYPLTDGLYAKPLRRLAKAAVDQWSGSLGEFLPEEIRVRQKLLDLPQAIRQIHFPSSQELLERARRRLAFDELLLLQVGMGMQKRRWREAQPGVSLRPAPEIQDAFRASLPFPLTSGQEEALRQVLADLGAEHPMMRLLQGDVGSGKTVVALIGLLVAIFSGRQGALMAPTEVLAEQHYRTITSLLSQAGMVEGQAPALPYPFVPIVRLLTGSTRKSEKSRILAAMASGEAHLLVSTHAAIQDEVNFAGLGLAVIDEQHRFGVAQRLAIRQKALGYSPHVLAMTATPIPRTLALTVYGDLDVSTIAELPPGRQKVMTRWLRPSQREKAYEFILRQIKEGRQAFIVCPLIEESENIEAKAAQEEYRRLSREVFPEQELGLLHGRLKSQDKEKVMSRFRSGEMDILVSTAVVEVGIDVPNATVMLVEGAERFGLAQLHQFRGRVGRGIYPSFCLLLEGNPSEEGRERLKVLENTYDGFALAQADLDLRGPGEFLGTRQSGLLGLRIARLSDLSLLETVRKEAQELLARDPSLEDARHQALRRELARTWKEEGVDFN
ncbi:MAG: ATP-dependent DNA helicase RecG [Dehalococcoidia bacterium]|nr:ATP-dependent DNA helicase RecG [Dehalococcoidia bacterium]